MLSLRSGDLESMAFPDVYFTPEYGRAGLTDAETWGTVVSADGAWQVPFVLREFATGTLDASSPYGYSGIFADPSLSEGQKESYWATTRELLVEQGVVSLFLRDSPIVPTYIPPESEIQWVVRGHQTVTVPISNEEAMWSAMEGRARTSVRKAINNGLRARVAHATAADVAPGSAFRVLYEATMLRVGASTNYLFPDDYYTSLVSSPTGRLALCSVTDSGDSVVAACLLMEHDALSHYHLSASTHDGAKSGANALMVWEAMKSAHAQGGETLMLGGGLSNQDSLLRFKRSFSRDTQLFNAFGVVLRPDQFAEALQQRSLELSCSLEELAATGFFPAYRAKP